MKIGVIFADTQEYLPFINNFKNDDSTERIVSGMKTYEYTAENGNKIIAVNSGIGKVNAAIAASALIYVFGASVILNAGLSGAVSGLRREDIVLGTDYVECDFDLTAIGYDLGVKPDEENIHKADQKLLELAKEMEGFSFKEGRLGTGDLFLTDKDKKNLYKKLFEISAFDMESAAIAAVCSKNEVPFLSIRKISDDADDASAETYTEMNNRQEVVLSQIVVEIAKKLNV